MRRIASPKLSVVNHFSLVDPMILVCVCVCILNVICKPAWPSMCGHLCTARDWVFSSRLSSSSPPPIVTTRSICGGLGERLGCVAQCYTKLPFSSPPLLSGAGGGGGGGLSRIYSIYGIYICMASKFNWQRDENGKCNTKRSHMRLHANDVQSSVVLLVGCNTLALAAINQAPHAYAWNPIYHTAFVSHEHHLKRIVVFPDDKPVLFFFEQQLSYTQRPKPNVDNVTNSFFYFLNQRLLLFANFNGDTCHFKTSTGFPRSKSHPYININVFQTIKNEQIISSLEKKCHALDKYKYWYYAQWMSNIRNATEGCRLSSVMQKFRFVAVKTCPIAQSNGRITNLESNDGIEIWIDWSPCGISQRNDAIKWDITVIWSYSLVTNHHSTIINDITLKLTCGSNAGARGRVRSYVRGSISFR